VQWQVRQQKYSGSFVGVTELDPQNGHFSPISALQSMQMRVTAAPPAGFSPPHDLSLRNGRNSARRRSRTSPHNAKRRNEKAERKNWQAWKGCEY
jgi:hypothetical protein